MRGTLIAAIAALTVGLFAGCGSGGDALPTAAAKPMGNMVMATGTARPVASMSAAEQAKSTAMIHISGFTYLTPMPVSPGATVSVMNMDGEAHTVTADQSGSFDVMAPAGQTVTFTAPSKPGNYLFHCAYHANMHGTLVVQ